MEPHLQQFITCPYPVPYCSSPCPPSHFPNTHFNIILLPTPGSSKWSRAVRIPHQNPVCATPPYVLHVLPISDKKSQSCIEFPFILLRNLKLLSANLFFIYFVDHWTSLYKLANKSAGRPVSWVLLRELRKA